jgi:hypothetical protein
MSIYTLSLVVLLSNLVKLLELYPLLGEGSAHSASPPGWYGNLNSFFEGSFPSPGKVPR